MFAATSALALREGNDGRRRRCFSCSQLLCCPSFFSWLGCFFALVRAQLQRRSVGRGRTCRVAFYFVFYFFSLSLFYFFVVGMLSDLRRGAAVCACDCLSVHAVASCPCFLRLHAWGQRESARAVLVCDGVSPLVGRQPKPHRDGRAHLHCRQTAARQRPMMQQYKLLKPPARWLAWLAGQRALRRPASLA